MLHDTMKTVKKAEKEAKQIVEEAKAEAAKIIEDAKTQAAQMKEAAKAESLKKADLALETVKKEESAKGDTFTASLAKEIEAGKKKAAKKEAEVLKAVLAAV